MATYNFKSQSNGGLSVFIDGTYQNTFFVVALADYKEGLFTVADTLGNKYTFHEVNDFEIEDVPLTGTSSEIFEAIVDILPSTVRNLIAETDPVFSAALPTLQPLITTGIGGQYYKWNKTFGQITFSEIGTLPTTLAGYGITDAATSSHTHTFASLTSKPTTLGGYGITDAYPLTGNPSSFLTANQTITISGDISGSGTSGITGTLATVNSNVGTYNSVTVNAKGLVTAASNVSYLTSYTETDPVFVANGVYKNGVSGGQTIIGGTAVGNTLSLSSNSGTKTKILFGSSGYDELNNRLGIGLNNPAAPLSVQSATSSGAVTTAISLFNPGSGSGTGAKLTFGYADTPTTNAAIAGLYSATAGDMLIGFQVGNTILGNISLKGWHVAPNSGSSYSIATAKLHIAAGSATAGTAPLKLTSGTNLTTAEPGAMEYNGTNLFFCRAGTTRESIACVNAVNTVSPTSPNRTLTVVVDGTTYYLHAKLTND